MFSRTFPKGVALPKWENSTVWDLVCWENISLDWLGALEKAMNAKLWLLVGSVEQRMT